MIVEDECSAAQKLSKSLARLGYDVVAIVDNGNEAIETATAMLPDLILMDVSLKGNMDGITGRVNCRDKGSAPARITRPAK